MLITRPNHDITTDYLYFWSISLIDFAKKVGLSVVDLSKKRANVKEFISVLKKVKPKLVVMNGHGNKSSITGYDNEILLNLQSNLALLEDKLVYARSCSSAKKFGKKSITKGCLAYIGYDDDFVFMINENKITRPLEDKTAELFLEPANHLVILLLKGHAAHEANQRSKEKYKQNILKLMTSSATQEEKELIPFLTRNYLHQVNLGDENATL
jgi:hypothetical protein